MYLKKAVKIHNYCSNCFLCTKKKRKKTIYYLKKKRKRKKKERKINKFTYNFNSRATLIMKSQPFCLSSSILAWSIPSLADGQFLISSAEKHHWSNVEFWFIKGFGVEEGVVIF